ncbi:MAG: TetR/AcrR family transcriptional regulator [Flavobacterium sp.]|uniref:TetR/AcrR family transcriptional regulator n=1 Tax=Flavobacterium sp. TaxID=239 RepID=UPI00122B85E9|nr:TetR/AcrR family transcriptional regulator [Flavobacterium sp.]RZJ65538.1 MAG: TetR/AcrR family transcriptional regulator [Flavobacterium sp.]
MARTKDFDESDVLGKAVCLFWHKGYNGTSMQELVDHLGISRSSLYDTFTDKHNLYLKSLEHYQQSSSGRMCTIVNNATSFKDAIKQLLELLTSDLLKDEQSKGCFLVNAEVEVAAHDEKVKEIIAKNEQGIEDAFHCAIKKGQDNGEIPKRQEARALARFIMNNVKGIQVSSKSVADKQFFADIIDTTLSVLD